MSLKAFHLVFIIASALLSVGFGAWCFNDYSLSDSLFSLILGVLSFLAAGGLAAYLVWFLKKLKNVSFLALAVGLSVGWLTPKGVIACPVCISASSPQQAAGINGAVLILLGLVTLLLMGFGGLFFFWARRARALTRDTLPTKAA